MPSDISSVSAQYGPIVTALFAVFAIAQCFFGYKLLKVLIATETFLIGLAVGGIIGHYFGLATGACVIIALVVAIIFAIISFKAYLVGVFVTTAGISFAMAYSIVFSLWNVKIAALIIGIVVGIIVGFVAVKFVRPVVILSTAICGGLCGAPILLQACNVDMPWLGLVLGIVFAVFGMIIQFKTSKAPATSNSVQ